MALPELGLSDLSLTARSGPAVVQPSGPLDRLVADGRAIGVRVVFDLTASTAPSHMDDPLPVVVVPDSLADLLEGFPTYGS